MKRTIVKEISAEKLFDRVWESVMSHGGDGCAAVVCKNPEEVAQKFADHIEKTTFKEFKKEAEFDIFSDDETYTFTWALEPEDCIIFTNGENIKLFPSDELFVLEEDLHFENGETLILKT